MSTTYETIRGDTFSLVAQKTTGTDTNSAEIIRANPGVSEPIPPGTILQIPGGKRPQKNFKKEGFDLFINNLRIDTVESFRLSTSIAAMRKAQVVIPNEDVFREAAAPLQFRDCEVAWDGTPMLTGFIRSPKSDSTEKRRTLMVPLMSTPVVLEDIPPPTSAYPLEFKDLNLEQITQKLVQPFGVSPFFFNSPGPSFDRIDMDGKNNGKAPNVLPYLANLAMQRNLMYSDDGNGSLICWDGASDGAPVLTVDEERHPDATINVTFNDAAYYGSVTCVLRGKSKRSRKTYTIINPYYIGPPRPYSFDITEADEGEMETACLCAMGRMFANAYTIKLGLSTWLDDNNQLLENKFLVKLRSPKDYIDDYFEFLIKGITFTKEPNVQAASLDLCLDSYGKVPERIPW